MKRPYFLALLIVALCLVVWFFLTLPASAHHPEIVQDASCRGYHLAANYVGGDQKKRLEWNVDVTINGIVSNISGSWEGVSDGKELFNIQGPEHDHIVATGTVKQFDKRGVLEKTETFNLNFEGQCITPTTTPTSTIQQVTSTPTITPEGPTQTPSPTVTVSPTSTPMPTSTPLPGPTQTPGPGPTSTPRPPEPETTVKPLDKGVQYGNK